MIEYEQEVEQLEEQAMARFITTPERVGRIRGRQEGRQEGREEGLQEGIQRMAELVIRILRRRFNSVPQFIIDKIQQADAEALLVWEEKIAAADKIEDVS
jgi:predicted transposase YdaD